MKRDGISGRVGGHVESDRLIEIRPDETAYVRVTHFPYEDHYVDYSLTDEHATFQQRESPVLRPSEATVEGRA